MTEQLAVEGDSFAPVTSAMGFLRAPLRVVAQGLAEWRQSIHGSVQVERLDGSLFVNVPVLEPLTSGIRPRELVVATQNSEWTALFDNGLQGGDPVSTVGYLASALGVQGVVVVSIPDVPEGLGRRPRYGARQLEMFAPTATDFLNYVRTISLTRDGSRWRFDANGAVQSFEDTEAYKRRRVVDRFSATMLVEYCAALGLRPFDPDFFPGPCILVRNPATPSQDALALSLRDAQEWLGVTPA